MEKPRSCDTFVAFPPATADGNVIFGKNSDRPGNEVQEIVYRPGKQYNGGEKLQVGVSPRQYHLFHDQNEEDF